MLVTNGNTKQISESGGNANSDGANQQDSLPVGLRVLDKLKSWLFPFHIPVAIKLAFSIGIMLTLVMSLLGYIIVQNQIKLIHKQVSLQGTTLVQTFASALSEQITLAQPAGGEQPKTDTLGKQDQTLTLKYMTARITSRREILGAVIFDAKGRILSHHGVNPFTGDAPYAKKEKQFLDGRLRIMEWHWVRAHRGDISAISIISPIELQNVVVGYAIITFNHDLLVKRTTEHAVQSIVIATFLMILLGIIFSYLMGRRLTRPLYDLMDASRAIGRGNYTYRLPERRNDEIGYLMTSFNAMAQGLYQKEQVEEAFSRHVSPSIAKEIIQNMDEVTIGGKQVHASVLFVDIVGFTSISESMPPEGVAQLLNEFYTNISKVSQHYNGVIDKFMGDCAMVVFGIPQEDEDHVFHSMACAVAFQKLMRQQNRERKDKGLFPIHFRIGVNTGNMLAGNMGSSERIQYTVVGDSVNLASRLCAAAPSDRIIITDETYNLSGLRRQIIATKHERMRIRGITNPVSTYLVQDLQEPHLSDTNRYIKHVTEELKQTESKKASVE